ncbi:MAG: hypothetical protein CMK59_08435 [Proteobacteria bacterium]|nr:hypothetical protein [Pseudomonadota bacterium]
MLPSSSIKQYLSLATRRSIIKRGLGFSIIVGSILVIINHGDRLNSDDIAQIPIYKVLLTYLVPYVVSSLSSIQAHLNQNTAENTKE